MNHINIGNRKVSELCLGGGKMVDISPEAGRALVQTAIECGINAFDAHHRYGNCENILGTYPNKNDLFYMTKISAYQRAAYEQILEQSAKNLNGKIDLLWVSDLDDKRLYDHGIEIYDEIVWKYNAVGITTEDPRLAIRFIDTHPECKYLMLPIFIGCRQEMIEAAKYAQDMGSYVFAIKPFDDGRCFKAGHSVKDCLEFLKGKVDVVVFGTSNPEHIKEIVNIWE